MITSKEYMIISKRDNAHGLSYRDEDNQKQSGNKRKQGKID